MLGVGPGGGFVGDVFPEDAEDFGDGPGLGGAAAGGVGGVGVGDCAISGKYSDSRGSTNGFARPGVHSPAVGRLVARKVVSALNTPAQNCRMKSGSGAADFEEPAAQASS